LGKGNVGKFTHPVRLAHVHGEHWVTNDWRIKFPRLSPWAPMLIFDNLSTFVHQLVMYMLEGLVTDGRRVVYRDSNTRSATFIFSSNNSFWLGSNKKATLTKATLSLFMMGDGFTKTVTRDLRPSFFPTK
jgi:hypothetical protein